MCESWASVRRTAREVGGDVECSGNVAMHWTTGRWGEIVQILTEDAVASMPSVMRRGRCGVRWTATTDTACAEKVW